MDVSPAEWPILWFRGTAVINEYLCFIKEGREKWGIALLPNTVLLAKLLKYAWSGNKATDTENRKDGDQNVPCYAIKKVEKLEEEKEIAFREESVLWFC